MELKQYASLFLRWWWLIVLGTVLAGAAAFFVSRIQTPVYEATTTLMINQASNSTATDYTAILTSEQLAQTYSQLLTKRPVLELTIAQLKLEERPEDLTKAITVKLVPNTQLITVSADYTNPAMAAQVANTLVKVFSEQNAALQTSRYAASIDSLSKEMELLRQQVDSTNAAIAALGSPTDAQGTAQLAQLQRDLTQYQGSYVSLLQSYETIRVAEAQSISNVVQVEPAVPPEKPIRPRTLLNTLLASVVGAMLAVGAVFLIEYLDDSIKTPEDAQRRLDLPVLGSIAHIGRSHKVGLYVTEHPRAPISEAFRSLRTNIQFASVDQPIRILVVSSAGPEEGKSTVAANLAAVMAQGGKKAILVEADLRRPSLHELLGLPNRLGLSDLFLRADVALEQALQPGGTPNMRVLTSGELPPNPAELMGSERMAKLLSEMRAQADLVVIDAPPVLVVTDAALLGARADGLLLVVQPGKTRQDAAASAVESLKRTGTRVLGVVFNNVPVNRHGYYTDYRYAYYYHSKKEKEEEAEARKASAGVPSPTAPDPPKASD